MLLKGKQRNHRFIHNHNKCSSSLQGLGSLKLRLLSYSGKMSFRYKENAYHASGITASILEWGIISTTLPSSVQRGALMFAQILPATRIIFPLQFFCMLQMLSGNEYSTGMLSKKFSTLICRSLWPLLSM